MRLSPFANLTTPILGNVIASAEGGLRECAFVCNQRQGCLSFNFNVQSNACEMLTITEEAVHLTYAQLLADANVNHYKRVGA